MKNAATGISPIAALQTALREINGD
jgi:hypothetical protein